MAREGDKLNYCTVRKVRLKWQQAGIETISEKSIINNIVALTTEYQRSIKKKKEQAIHGSY